MRIMYRVYYLYGTQLRHAEFASLRSANCFCKVKGENALFLEDFIA